MAAPQVAQLQALEAIFAEDLVRFRPRELAVIGCATGNGFGHVESSVRRLVAVDINPAYLDLVRRRYGEAVPQMELICGDAAATDLGIEELDLVHAALIFEYLHPPALLDRVAPAIRRGGILTAVLQMPSSKVGAVSPSGVASVRLLAGVLRMVDPAAFRTAAEQRGLLEVEAREVPLPNGKRFHVVRLRRS
jgi:ubiquinone/menaquinone biosynthesis C-methylase UbiE